MTDNLTGDPPIRLGAPASPWGPGYAPQPNDLTIGQAFTEASKLYSGFAPSEYESIARMYKGTEIDPNFDPFSQPEMRERPDLALRLAFSRSRGEFDAIYSAMNREEARKRDLSEAGFTGFAMSSLASMYDPGTMLAMISPIGVGVRAGSMIGALGGAASLASQASRSNLNFMDMTLNIGLGAAFGAASGATFRPSIRLAEAVEQNMENRSRALLGELGLTEASIRNVDSIENVLVETRLAGLREAGVAIKPEDAIPTDIEKRLATYLSGETPFIREDGSLAPGIASRGSLPSDRGPAANSTIAGIFDWFKKYEIGTGMAPIQSKEGLVSFMDQLARDMKAANVGDDVLAGISMVKHFADVIPEAYYRNMRLILSEDLPRYGRFTEGVNGLFYEGTYKDGVRDLLMVALQRQSPGTTFAHEVGHRIAHRFIDEESMLNLHGIWSRLGRPDPGWGSAFDEWIAEEFRKAVERARGGMTGKSRATRFADQMREAVDYRASKGEISRARVIIEKALISAEEMISNIARRLGNDPEVARQNFFDSLITNPREMVFSDETVFKNLDLLKELKVGPQRVDGMLAGSAYDPYSYGIASASPADAAAAAAAPDNRLVDSMLRLERMAINPTLRLMNSPIGVIRDFATRALDLGGLYMRQHFQGEAGAIPAEVAIKVNHLPRYVDALLTHRDQYMAYRQRLAGKNAAPGTYRPVDSLKQFAHDVVRGRGGAMSATEFDDAVGLQLHGIDQNTPEIKAAASTWRSFYNETWRLGQEADLWTRDTRNALGSLYKKRTQLESRISEDQVELKLLMLDIDKATRGGRRLPQETYDRVAELRKSIRQSNAAIKSIMTQEPELFDDIDKIRSMTEPPKPINAKEYFPLSPRTDLNEKEKKDLEDLFYKHMSRGVVDTKALDEIHQRSQEMVQRWVGDIPFDKFSADTVGIARSMHQRDLPISIEQLLPYIDTNVERVTRSYMRRVGAEIELSRAFAGMNAEEVIDSLKRRGLESIAGLPPIEKAKAKNKLSENLEDVRAIFERIVGVYGMPASAQDLTAQAVMAAKSFTYMTTSGPHAIISLPDLARPFHVFGLKRAFGSLISPFLRGNLSMLKMSAAEARLFGEASQTALGMFGLMTTEFGALNSRSGLGKVATRLNSTANGIHLLNLMAPFEDMSKRMATIVSSSVLMDNIMTLAGKKPGELADHELARLARVYIDKDMAKKIADEFEFVTEQKLGGKDGMLYAPATHAWRDLQAQKTFRAAMSSMVNTVIVTPGVGDTPLWMSTQLGSALAMYKRFGLASTQRVTMSGLQSKDANFWTGMSAMLALGAMSQWSLGAAGYAKLWEDMDLEERFSKAVDRSGVLGVFSDAWSTWERLAGDRTSWPGFVGAVAGPIGGQATHAAMGFGKMMSGEFTADTFRHLTRLTPAGGVLFMRPQVDALAESLIPN